LNRTSSICDTLTRLHNPQRLQTNLIYDIFQSAVFNSHGIDTKYHLSVGAGSGFPGDIGGKLVALTSGGADCTSRAKLSEGLATELTESTGGRLCRPDARCDSPESVSIPAERDRSFGIAIRRRGFTDTEGLELFNRFDESTR
jgi:hypothetical protein